MASPLFAAAVMPLPGGGFGSSSSSTPVSVTSAQTDWGLMQSQLLSALADRTYNWAMDQYAKGEGVTSQTIAQFLEMSGKGKGLADTLLHQYQDQIKPLMDQYIREAGTYASEERQRFEAGKAMSTVAQADTAAMNEIERRLTGQGINVNSGRIQEQMIASRVADAAARAGAGTEAANRTQDIGRQMLGNAIQMGQQIPGQAVGAIQSAYAGLTGAESAILGLLNTGKSLVDAAAPYHNAAVAANKVPPVGQLAQSESRTPGPQGGGGGGKGGGKEPKEGGGKGGGKGDGDGKGGGGRGDGTGGEGGGPRQMGVRDTGAYGKEYRNPLKTEEEKTTGEPETPADTGPTYFDPQTGLLNPEWGPSFGRDQAGELYTPETAPWNESPVWNQPMDPRFEQPFNLGTPDNWQTASENVPLGMGAAPVPGADGPSWSNPFGNFDGQFGNQNAGQFDGGVGAFDMGIYGSQGQQDFQSNDAYGGQDFGSYDAGSDFSDWTDAGENDSGDGDSGGYYYDAGDDTSDWTDAGENDSSGQDDGGYYYDAGDDTSDWTDAGENDSSGQDDGGYYYDAGDDTSDWTDYGGDYARGGPVRPGRPPQRRQRGVMPTTGGAVPRSASPSRGRQTDDISARLNAGEYVIPKDVVSHKGTEFFTKMIQNSRKLRTGMAGAKPKPTMRPALPHGRPAFRSRPLPPR
jgi:hypothetical protein